MKTKLETYVLPVLSGILLSWAFPRFHWFWLAWVALVPLFWSARRSDARGAALRFLVAGYVFHTILLQWLCANIFWAGGWAILAQQGLCVLLALHWAAVGFLWKWLERRFAKVPGALWLPLLWFGMEWLMARWLSGFGWSALGYSQGVCLPIAQWAGVFSEVSVLSLLIVLENLLLALALAGKPRFARLVMAFVLMVLVVGGGYSAMNTKRPEPGQASATPFRVGIVQPSVPQEIKWDPYFDEFIMNMLDTQARALAKEGALNLVVWPEAAVPGDLARESTLAPLRALTRDTGAPLLTGITRDDLKARKSYNAVCLITPEGEVAGVYDKIHLAPWGEYIPFEQWFPFLKGIAYGGVDAGTELKVFSVDGRKVGPLVCFEVLFSPLSKKLKAMGADCIAVVTNLSWFGQSNAIVEELELARFRAIETGLPLIHSSNTGISGVFDGLGRFAPVSDYLRKDGGLVQYPLDRITPAMVQGQRLVGSFDLPHPITPSSPLCIIVFSLFLGLFAASEWRFKVRLEKTADNPKP